MSSFAVRMIIFLIFPPQGQTLYLFIHLSVHEKQKEIDRCLEVCRSDHRMRISLGLFNKLFQNRSCFYETGHRPEPVQNQSRLLVKMVQNQACFTILQS